MTDDSEPLDPFTTRLLWFVPLWYAAFTTALMDVSKQLVMLTTAVIVGTALVVGGYSSSCEGDQT